MKKQKAEVTQLTAEDMLVYTLFISDTSGNQPYLFEQVNEEHLSGKLTAEEASNIIDGYLDSISLVVEEIGHGNQVYDRAYDCAMRYEFFQYFY